MVPLYPALEPLILDYLNTRLPLRERALFVGVQGRRLSITVLSQTFRHYAARAGVDRRKRVTPHTLRHAFASELLSAGANQRQIRCSATSTSTPPSATRASPPTSCAARSSGCAGRLSPTRPPR